jgi:hypothetical protein
MLSCPQIIVQLTKMPKFIVSDDMIEVRTIIHLLYKHSVFVKKDLKLDESEKFKKR